MNEMLELLYNGLDETFLPNNLFEPSKVRESFDRFAKKWFQKQPNTTRDEILTELVELCCLERRNAFSVGFYAAVKLLTNF